MMGWDGGFDGEGRGYAICMNTKRSRCCSVDINPGKAELKHIEQSHNIRLTRPPFSVIKSLLYSHLSNGTVHRVYTSYQNKHAIHRTSAPHTRQFLPTAANPHLHLPSKSPHPLLRLPTLTRVPPRTPPPAAQPPPAPNPQPPPRPPPPDSSCPQKPSDSPSYSPRH